MALPKLDTCCGCATLATGSKIIGWLELIGNILLATTYILLMAQIGQTIYNLENEIQEYQIHNIQTSTNNTSSSSDEELIKLKSGLKLAYITNGIVIGIAILNACLDVCLLVGIHKENANLMKVWLYPKIILLILVGLLFAISSGLFVFVLSAPGIALELYFMWVVFSHMCKLKIILY